ncbi:MAG TPA: tetratricopeptide repeat protein [Kiritimatiellia bacterium]
MFAVTLVFSSFGWSVTASCAEELRDEIRDEIRNEVVLVPVSGGAQTVSSSALTQQAWLALEKRRYDLVLAAADECLRRFGGRAVKQQQLLSDYAPRQAALKYWALNDVATCMFIKGTALKDQRKKTEAKAIFRDIINEYPYAQCWDPRGWFWKVASAAQDQIDCIDLNIDFGDYTSESLTTRAWGALDSGKYRVAELFANKCIELYVAEAKKMQVTLDNFAPKGSEFNYWALNDVATCYFIKGRILQRQGKNKDAQPYFRTVVEEFPSGQCWDPRGWFWKVAQAARGQLFAAPKG